MENTTGMQAHLIPCFEMRSIWEIPFCRKATLQTSFQKGVLLMMEIFRSIILKITVFEDGFHQEFVIIDNDESKLYDSIADAKRVIRGEQPYYEIN